MLGVLASATDFSVKYVLYSFPIQSVVKFRPKSKFEVLVFYKISVAIRQEQESKGSFPFKAEGS